MTAIHALRSENRNSSPSQYRTFRFTYRFDGAEWSIDIPALSLAEAKQRVNVLGFARYEGEARPALARTSAERRPRGWFSRAMRQA